ncbi:MAG TPA: hypothetical protein VGP72_01180 [Planctomycetota bacterium]
MIIVYCEKCGRRVSEDEIAGGSASKSGEGAWLCSACAPSAAKPQAFRPSTAHAKAVALPRRTTGSHPAAVQPAPDGETAEPKRSALPLIALAGGGVCMLLAGIVLLVMSRGSVQKTRTAESKPPEQPIQELAQKKDPPAKNSTASVREKDHPPTAVRKPNTPEAAEKQAPETKELSVAERARETDKLMENFRDSRAAKLLEEHKAWFKQNPTDPWEYQSKLRDFISSYRSTPAAGEAAKLLAELKTLPAPPDKLETIPEAKDFQLVYDLNLSRLGREVTYDVDNRSKIKQPIDRIGYFMELKPSGGTSQYVFVSMDAFTDDLGKIGVPTFGSGAHFQQNVANMNVYSNVAGVVNGTALAGGNIEFWPHNYGPRNAANVPDASNDKYDFGDEWNPGGDHGSMQVHNHDAKQTVFALNHWIAGGNADMGIGNNPGDNPDWTFSNSGGSYSSKRLRVLVHVK